MASDELIRTETLNSDGCDVSLSDLVRDYWLEPRSTKRDGFSAQMLESAENEHPPLELKRKAPSTMVSTLNASGGEDGKEEPKRDGRSSRPSPYPTEAPGESGKPWKLRAMRPKRAPKAS
mmetsp:Transcript_12753/g.27814  ORF Transcript_12753/g.27814 Transcript_12753/m.27814 type:complete len:120 (-) Transcript_12753:906-1265(-)|eukprot:CAMPEP_0185844606 /NCGR_PEP_ID=MMETSP1354-20130828/709_1 /TAXON_ID=708628 /ORGANISM="Erythrolobus madagascarensis, Strain CCMP3276" /LENGTH=119 /DNA_ID=CAMNT_0028544295 /DNA_START=30 /DNA_END=389 /DNA_ORIENTATION=+